METYRNATEITKPLLVGALDAWLPSIPVMKWLTAAMIAWVIISGTTSFVLVLLMVRSHQVWPAEIKRLRDLASAHFSSTDTLASLDPVSSKEVDGLPFSNFVSFPMVDPAALTPFHRRASHVERMRYLDGIYTTSLVLNGRYR